MKKLIPLILTVLLVGCASSGDGKPPAKVKIGGITARPVIKYDVNWRAVEEFTFEMARLEQIIEKEKEI